jgi:hypothetical protein
MRGRVALARGLDYRKARESGQAKSPMRAILRQPKPDLEVELAPNPNGKNLIDSKPKFAKLWIILKRLDGPVITTIRTEVPAHFVSRNGGRAMAKSATSTDSASRYSHLKIAQTFPIRSDSPLYLVMCNLTSRRSSVLLHASMSLAVSSANPCDRKFSRWWKVVLHLLISTAPKSVQRVSVWCNKSPQPPYYFELCSFD